MIYKEFKVGAETYKLRLSTSDIINLEQELNCNPLLIFGKQGDKIPTVTTMVSILFHSLQSLQHGINRAEANKIFDRWIEEEEKTVVEFVEVIVDIFKVSGLIKNEKN